MAVSVIVVLMLLLVHERLVARKSAGLVARARGRWWRVGSETGGSLIVREWWYAGVLCIGVLRLCVGLAVVWVSTEIVGGLGIPSWPLIVVVVLWVKLKSSWGRVLVEVSLWIGLVLVCVLIVVLWRSRECVL